MSLPVAILAGGRAIRLGGLASARPKALMDVDGRPFVLHQLEMLRRHGLTDVVLCTGHLGDLIEQAVGDGSRWDVRVRYSPDGPALLGTGGALRRALPLLGGAFFVLYGDAYLDCDYHDVERAFHDSGRLALMTVFRNENRWDTSNVEFDSGRIVRYDKRDRTPQMHHIDYGLSVLTDTAIGTYPEAAVMDLATIYQDLIAAGQLAAYEVSRRFFEIGTPEGLDEFRRHVAAVRQ